MAGRPRDPGVDEAIVAAATVLFARDGIASTSMEGVAAEAGVSKASLYRRFVSKEELVGGVVAQVAAARPVVPDTGRFDGDLRAAVRMLRDVADDAVLRQLVAELLATTVHRGSLARMVEPFLRARRASIGAVFDRASRRGELTGAVDREVVVDVVIGAVLARLLSGADVDDRFEEDLVAIVFAATEPMARTNRRSHRAGT